MRVENCGDKPLINGLEISYNEALKNEGVYKIKGLLANTRLIVVKAASFSFGIYFSGNTFEPRVEEDKDVKKYIKTDEKVYLTIQ